MLNISSLIAKLQDSGIPVNSISDNDGTQAGLVINYNVNVTQAQQDAGNLILLNYDFNNPYVSPKQDALSRLMSSPLASQTPAQIYSTVQGQVDGWSTLAQAKSDLRVLLPLLAAGLVWLNGQN